MLFSALLNMFGVSITALLNSISAWWHMAGVAFIVLVLIIVPDNHQSFSYVFGETINNSGFSGTGFGDLDLLVRVRPRPADGPVHDHRLRRLGAHGRGDAAGLARRGVGMIMSVVVSVIFGFLLLVAMTFAIPDTQGVIDAGGGAVTYIWETALGTRWAELLLFIAVVAQIFCNTASVTSASRMMFAFSRDGAIPGHQLWRKVSRRRVPVHAVWAISFLAWALMIPTLWNAFVGYLVGTSIAVIGLYIAFALPIYLRWRQGESYERGEWHLGAKYKWIDPIALAWITLISILFLAPITPTGIPWKDGFNWEVVNYAPLTVGGAFLFFGGWWVLSANKWFKGPIRQGSEEELERIEEEIELGHMPA